MDENFHLNFFIYISNISYMINFPLTSFRIQPMLPRQRRTRRATNLIIFHLFLSLSDDGP